MPKLAKSLTLAASGVPAAAIFTACAINAGLSADLGTVAHTENVSNVMAEPEVPAKPAVAKPYAVVQPRSLAPPGGDTKATLYEDMPDATTNTKQVSMTSVADVKKKLASEVVAYAKAQLGKPYVFGAEGPHAFDCSGLVQAAYRSAGIAMPRTSDVQYWFGKRVHAGQERPGDLVYFDYKPGHSGPGHVGIVLNPARGLMIVAPHTGDHVKIQSYKRYPGGPAGFTRPLDRPAMQHKLDRMAK